MKCPKCGHWVFGDLIVCKKCGYNVNAEFVRQSSAITEDSHIDIPEALTHVPDVSQHTGKQNDAQQLTIKGGNLEHTVAKLVEQSRREGWNIFASISINCTSCDLSFRFSNSSGQLELLGSERSFRKIADPFECHSCKGNEFNVANLKITMEHWLHACCQALEPSTHDPNLGFIDGERGGTVKDHGFLPGGTFKHLWTLIKPKMDLFGDLNPRASFNMVWSKGQRCWFPIKDTSSIVHINFGTDRPVEIIKDKNEDLWVTFEGR